MMRRLALLLLVASCSSETITEGICGNGIVDPFEDCDADTDRCVSCSITCGSDTDCTDYDPGTTDGFVCGPDGRCHAPTGIFERGNTFSIQATDYRISDVDHDGVGDLLVQSQTSVSAVIGPGDPATFASSSIQTPIAFGAAGFADVDGDGALDTVLPTADGIAAFTSSFGTPAPYPFPSTIGPGMGVPKFVNPLAPTHMLFVGTDDPDPENHPDADLLMIAMDVSQNMPTPIGAAKPCGLKNFSSLVANDIDVIQSSFGHQLYALTLHPKTGPLQVCLVAVDFNNISGDYDITPILVTLQTTVNARAILAPLKGEACPSLLTSEGPGILKEYPAVSANPPCSFGAPVAVAGAPFGATPVGFVPLDPPLGAFGSPFPTSRPVAMVLSTGIYAQPLAGGNLVQLYNSDRTLSKVRFEDVDQDGDTDVVASAVVGPAAADDLDILDRRDDGGFIRFRFDTAAPVTNFLIGDYDGNEIPDVAYVERDFDNGHAVERLEISFGTFDQLLPGVTVGAFFQVDTLIPASFFDSTDPFNVISDLVVLGKAREGDVNFVLSLLHGSPQRAMLAFFDPRSSQPPPQGSAFRGVAVGRFSDNPLGNDVLAVEQIATSSITNFYLSKGDDAGAQQLVGLPGSTQDAALCGAGPNSGSKLCVDQAIYGSWPGELNDRVIAIDSSLVVASFDPAALKPPDPTKPPPDFVIDRWPGRLLGSGKPHAIRQVAFADGTPRLLVSLAAAQGDDPRLTGAVNLCTFDPAAGPTCVDVGARIAELSGQDVTCVDAAVANMTTAARFSPPVRSGPDLLVVCHHPKASSPDVPPVPDSVFQLIVEGDEIVSATPLFLDVLSNSTAIEVGDVTGDGIDDIVVLDRGALVSQFLVFRQCTSRDIACGAVASVGEDSP